MRLTLISTNDTDHSVIVSVDNVRYEYWLGDHYQKLSYVKWWIRKGVNGRALSWLKQHAIRTDKL